VAQFSDFLTRFRPASVPGSAATAAVPADKAAALAAELDPVLELLASTDQWCAGVIAAAEQEAARLMSEAAEKAAGITALGRRQADEARKAAAGEVMALAGTRRNQLLQAADEAVHARALPAETDVQALIDQAIDFVKSVP
jgi:hypothetical protein